MVEYPHIICIRSTLLESSFLYCNIFAKNAIKKMCHRLSQVVTKFSISRLTVLLHYCFQFLILHHGL